MIFINGEGRAFVNDNADETIRLEEGVESRVSI
jgi:hypothetical protein